MEENKIKCEGCGKEVKNSWDLDRDGDCDQCRRNYRMNEGMTVGDLHNK